MNMQNKLYTFFPHHPTTNLQPKKTQFELPAKRGFKNSQKPRTTNRLLPPSQPHS